MPEKKAGNRDGTPAPARQHEADHLDAGRMSESWAQAQAASTWLYLLLIAIGIGILVTLAPDFGKSWDVDFCERRGQAAYAFYFDGFNAARYLKVLSYGGRYYGPAFDVLVKLAQDSFADPGNLAHRFEIRTALQALFSLSSLIPVFLLSARVVSKPLALICAILLLSTPVYLGHAFINPKDSIFASSFMWTLYLLVLCFGQRERPKLGYFAVLGLLMALTASFRTIGLYLLLLLPVAAMMVPAFSHQGGNTRDFVMGVWEQSRAFLTGTVVLLAVFVLAYLLFMPAVLSEILTSSSSHIVGAATNYPWKGRALYMGELYLGRDIPSHYLPVYLFVQLPLFYHLALLMCLAVLVVMPSRACAALRQFAQERTNAVVTVVFLLTALVVPLLLVLSIQPVLYNAGRQMLFIVPLICMLSYFGFVGSVKLLPFSLRALPCSLLAIAWLEAVLAAGRLHPYEYTYYNPLVRPANVFELDYWGTSFREVARYLDEYASANATGRLRVFVCGSRRLLEPFLDASKFEFLTRKEFDRGDVVPDLIVAQNLASIRCMKLIDKKSWLFTVEREGAVLAAVARDATDKGAAKVP